jgi:hypothetical protein
MLLPSALPLALDYWLGYQDAPVLSDIVNVRALARQRRHAIPKDFFRMSSSWRACRQVGETTYALESAIVDEDSVLSPNQQLLASGASPR